MAKKASQKPEPGLRFVFLCYGLLMLYLLFIRGRHAVDGVPYLDQVRENYNLMPFHTIGNYWHILTNKAYYLAKWSYGQYLEQVCHSVVNLVGNVVMFVPLGYFIPRVGTKYRRFFRCMGLVFLLILAVEILQLVTLLGSCDIDDLLLNILGAAMGYILWKKRKRK